MKTFNKLPLLENMAAALPSSIYDIYLEIKLFIASVIVIFDKVTSNENRGNPG